MTGGVGRTLFPGHPDLSGAGATKDLAEGALILITLNEPGLLNNREVMLVL